MLSVLISGLAVAALPQQPARVQSLTGNIEKITSFDSKALGNTRNLTIYLPPQYEKEPARKFPVIYMHDGQNCFDGSTSYLPNQEWRADETAEMLNGAGMMEPVIIVAIDNAGADRANEYLPTEIKLGNSTAGGKAEQYGAMIMEEIMPMMAQRYRIKTGPQNTGLIGASFGGVITGYLGNKYPGVFGKLGIVSPSIWVDDRILVKLIQPPQKGIKRPRIWLDMGTLEGPNSVAELEALSAMYKAMGWKQKSELMTVIEPRGEHNEAAWARRLPSIFTYLFPATSSR